MAKIRIAAPKSSTWLPQLGGWTNLGGLNKIMANIPAADAAPTVNETTGISKPETKEHANGYFVLIAYVLVVAGAWLGNWIASKVTGVTFTPATDVLDTIGFLALFFVMAQAIERLMEPIAELDLKWMGSARKNKQNERDTSIKKAEDASNDTVRQENANAAANSEAEANQIAANTKVLMWGLASFVAMLASGATKVFFLEVIGFKGIAPFINVLITGLVIGGGTKPLHDLIKLIEKRSEDTSEDSDGETNP